METLRDIRLFHWREAMRMRRRAKGYTAKGNNAVAKALNKQANKHTRYVQVLNDHFPIGDTAERDDVNTR